MAPPRTPPRGLVLATVAWVAAAECGSPPAPASSAELAAYRARRGELAAAETTFLEARGRYGAYRVRLTSGTGLVATGRLLRPLGSAGRHPAVLLNDGRELDSRAVDYLPPEFGDVVVLSLDYPREFPYELDLSTAVLRQRRLRAAARRIPALFSLGGAYLARRADVDSARVAVVATSFAVPFAVIAAAVDERFRNVGLVYGAGDLAGVLAANLELRPRRARGVAARVAMRPFREFAPERFAAHVAPRPIVMVNGADDPQMPRPAVEALYAAAREPKALIWLRTGHLLPTDTALVRALVDTALARMPVLAGATRPAAR